MERLLPVHTKEDINAHYQNTPIASLLEYHNLKKEMGTYTSAQILIGMCMDNRKALRIPENFAFILRSGGGNLRYSEFKVSYAIAVGGVKSIALIAHNDCGMVNLFAKKDKFVDGLVNAGWDQQWAEEHFINFSPMYEIGNEIDFVLSEARRLRQRYPRVLIAPLYYQTKDNLLYQVKEQ